MSDTALGATESDTVFVFAAGDPGAFDHAPTLAWLRRLAAAGATLGGISGGAWVLARAGLLDGHRATILQTLNRRRVDQFRRCRDEPLPMLRRVRALPLLAQLPNPA